MATASSASGGMSSLLRKQSTMSMRPPWARTAASASRTLAWAFSPRMLPPSLATSGFTGTMRQPCACMYLAAKKLGRCHWGDRPTTASVRHSASTRRRVEMVSGVRLMRRSVRTGGPPGQAQLRMSALRNFAAN